MIILINASNLRKGGAIQVSHSFLHEIKQETKYSFHVVLSKTLFSQINHVEYPQNFQFYKYTKKNNLFYAILGKDKFLDKISIKIQPNCVFTIFGPSYWKPNFPHLIGFADGWCYNPNSIAYKKIQLLKRIKFKLVSFFKVYRIKKEHDIIVVETKDAKQKLIDLFSFKYSNIVVIGNTFNNVFNDANKLNNKYYSVENKKFYLLTVSANYPHKNLEIIKKIVPYLKFYKIKIHFFVTLQQIDFQELFFDLEEYVTNLGPLEVADLPDAYLRCNAVFMPSLLETFSATYPEAMKMEKPILTSDLSFARDICGPAAEYFDPLNPEDILQKIINLINNKDRQLELIRFGKERLKTFETSESRARKYLELCEKLVNEKL